MMFKVWEKKKVHVSFIATPGDVNNEVKSVEKDFLHSSKNLSLAVIGW